MIYDQAFRITRYNMTTPIERDPSIHQLGTYRAAQFVWATGTFTSTQRKSLWFSYETYTCTSRVRHIHVLLVWDVYMYFSCETYTCTFVFSDFRWEVVVNFVDIGGVEHHLINCLISGDCLTLLERRETYFHGENKLPLDEVKTSSALY